jgi:hypothetical protein
MFSYFISIGNTRISPRSKSFSRRAHKNGARRFVLITLSTRHVHPFRPDDSLDSARQASTLLFSTSPTSVSTPAVLSALGSDPRIKRIPLDQLRGQSLTKIAAQWGLVESNSAPLFLPRMSCELIGVGLQQSKRSNYSLQAACTSIIALS